jgi:hypothetical protein
VLLFCDRNLLTGAADVDEIGLLVVVVLHKKALLRLLPKWRAPDMQNQTTGVRAYQRITPFRLHLTSGDRYSI